MATPEEKVCYQVINDLDHIAYKVDNSKTNKKHMRNELWSTIGSRGAPSWFIIFASTNLNHPISLYYAGSSDAVFPSAFTKHERYKLIANNPVACTRFFYFLVRAFLKHVLGMNNNQIGLFGKTEGYYGTVEEQGRNALHLHLLLWLISALTPQQIRDRLLDADNSFQKSLIEYLESLHQGSYISRDPIEIQANLEASENSDGSHTSNSIFTLPTALLPKCAKHSDNNREAHCIACVKLENWTSDSERPVHQIICQTSCHSYHEGCTGARYPKCKSQFPREVISESKVDPKTGHLTMKHGEPYINTFNPLITYLLRCNSDITSLSSGTAVKAVIAYTTDYISKNPLRTHTMLEVIKEVFNRHSEFINGDAG